MSRIEISKKIVLINSTSSAAVLVLNLTILIWLQQYLLKRISPDEYALLPLVMAVMAFAPLLTSVLTGGLGRYITVAYARGDDEEITRICSTMFPLLLVGGVVVLALGWLAAWHIDVLLKIKPEYLNDARLMMALVVFSTAIRLPLAIFGSGFVVRQKLMLQDMIDVGCQAVRLGLLFALLFGVGAKVLWVIVALIVGELLNLAISTPISIRLVPAQRVRYGFFNGSLAKEMTSYGSWSLVVQLAETLKQAMDPIILNRFATSMDVSVLYVAGIAPRQLSVILLPITRPLIPILAALCATGDRITLGNTYLRIARYHTWLLLFFAVPGIAFSNELILLYLGEVYSSAALVMSILLLSVSMNGLNAIGGHIAVADGQVKGFALRTLLLQLVNLGFLVVLVAFLHGGAVGAAGASLAASMLVNVTLVWPYCRKLAGVTTRVWLQEVVFPCLSPAAASAAYCIAMLHFFDIDSWFQLIALSALSGLVFGIVVLWFGLRPQDWRDIDRLIERIPARFSPLLRAALRNRR